MLAAGTPTYVFVYELALVSVVQVDELGGTLLLPVHPATDVLAASLCIQVGALPVPSEDRTRACGHCPVWRTGPRTEEDLSRGRLCVSCIWIHSKVWHASTHGTVKKPGASTI